MFIDLIDLAKSLDEHIEKGEKLEKKKKERASDLRKSLTFDPYNPVPYHEDSGYYNPYRLVDGGYLPHPVEYWRGQGNDQRYIENGQPSHHFVDNYLTTQQLYEKFKPIEEARTGFRAFRRSLEMDLIKAGAVPVGTVHTYSDGQRYVKQAEGKWVPVAANDGRMRKYLAHPNKEWSGIANKQIGEHADRVQKIKDLIEQKSENEKGNPKLKEALDTMKQHFSKFYDDGKIPDEVHEFFEKVAKNPDGLTEASKPVDKKTDQDSKKQISDAPKKHHVGVEFTHNGQNYTHDFKDIQASSHGEAVSKIMKIMEKRLPGHQLTRIRSHSPKEEKQNEPTP